MKRLALIAGALVLGLLWFGILPISAGVFGVALGLLVTTVVSLLTHGSD